MLIYKTLYMQVCYALTNIWQMLSEAQTEEHSVLLSYKLQNSWSCLKYTETFNILAAKNKYACILKANFSGDILQQDTPS